MVSLLCWWDLLCMCGFIALLSEEIICLHALNNAMKEIFYVANVRFEATDERCTLNV